MAKGKKGKKGGGGGGGGKKAATAAEAADDGAAAGGEGSEEVLLEQLGRALLQAVPSLDDVAELPAELARHLMPRATQRIAAEEVRLRLAARGDRSVYYTMREAMAYRWSTRQHLPCLYLQRYGCARRGRATGAS